MYYNIHIISNNNEKMSLKIHSILGILDKMWQPEEILYIVYVL